MLHSICAVPVLYHLAVLGFRVASYELSLPLDRRELRSLLARGAFAFAATRPRGALLPERVLGVLPVAPVYCALAAALAYATWAGCVRGPAPYDHAPRAQLDHELSYISLVRD